jgi:hypothetical protein
VPQHTGGWRVDWEEEGRRTNLHRALTVHEEHCSEECAHPACGMHAHNHWSACVPLPFRPNRCCCNAERVLAARRCCPQARTTQPAVSPHAILSLALFPSSVLVCACCPLPSSLFCFPFPAGPGGPFSLCRRNGKGKRQRAHCTGGTGPTHTEGQTHTHTQTRSVRRALRGGCMCARSASRGMRCMDAACVLCSTGAARASAPTHTKEQTSHHTNTDQAPYKDTNR